MSGRFGRSRVSSESRSATMSLRGKRCEVRVGWKEVARDLAFVLQAVAHSRNYMQRIVCRSRASQSGAGYSRALRFSSRDHRQNHVEHNLVVLVFLVPVASVIVDSTGCTGELLLGCYGYAPLFDTGQYLGAVMRRHSLTS